MDPLPSILMLLAVYQAGEYGGSISAITLNIPGTQSAVATTLDGNALARKSYPGKALGYSLAASTIGGFFGGLVLLFFTIPLSEFAKKISSPEYFLLGILALLAVVGLSSKNVTKGLISIILGLMAGTVGIDLLSGVQRVTLGFPELMEGISIIVMVIALFAFSEIYSMISKNMHEGYLTDSKGLKVGLKRKEYQRMIKPSIIGSVIGSIIGIIPGLGSGASSWMAYIAAKKTSRSPETFGKGNPEGIVAPESANNSTVGSALIPLLSLGIPGSPTIAIIMGAFIIQGIQPGPRIFNSNLDLVYGIFYGFLLTTVAMYLLGRFVTPLFARALAFPNSKIVPIILVLSIVGVYASHELFFHLWLVLILGIASYFLKELDFSLPSILLAFVLGPIIEENLRRTLIISDGGYSIFFTRGYSLAILLIILAILVYSFVSWYKNKKVSNEES
jgi:putative tricarboxylic transport membrane protein